MNLILQHWAGDMPELVRLSMENIRAYAVDCEAHYARLRDYPVSERLSPPCQKLHMLDEMYDDYDTVVMLDADMFARTSESIFDVPGDAIGWNQAEAHKRAMKLRPGLTSPEAPFWGGAIYRLTREQRKALRAEIDFDEMKQFDDISVGLDEGIMHRLAMRAGMTTKGAYLDYRWSYSSYEAHPETAAFIHVRTKITPTGPRQTKLENYHRLRDQGILE